MEENNENMLKIAVRFSCQKDLDEFAKLIGRPNLALPSKKVKKIKYPISKNKGIL